MGNKWADNMIDWYFNGKDEEGKRRFSYEMLTKISMDRQVWRKYNAMHELGHALGL